MCRHRMCGGEYDYYDIDDHVLVEAHFIPGLRRQYRNGSAHLQLKLGLVYRNTRRHQCVST